MADLLKDMYNYDSLKELAKGFQEVDPRFPIDDFIKMTMDDTWEQLELKGRVRQVSRNLGYYLPTVYEEALASLDQVVAKSSGFFGIIFPDFVEVYGQGEKDWDRSIQALARYTPYSSSEFAVRPFIMKDQERMMAQMLRWSGHPNEHIRRLASEGCRPQLPWGQALKAFKEDPSPIFPILEQLKKDSSLSVRKSVANNLNDISKTHPQLVVKMAQNWYGSDRETDWIVKHGCRTLLKKGNREVLAIFGYHDVTSFKIDQLIINTQKITIGEKVSFSFTIKAKKETKIRLEYGVDYVKANGKRNRKIFQLSEGSLKADEIKEYRKNHAFADLSTRKHYPGIHHITLIINGSEQGTVSFELDS